MKTLASVFAGTSVDGFIARADHALDFLPEDGGGPHGFEEFFASVDVLVMGRNTYDKVLSFGAWPYEKKPVIVLSHRPIDMPSDANATVERMSGTPEQILTQLAARGCKHAYIDGGITVTQFLAAGCIQRIIVTQVPVLIGTGIPLFGALPADIKLKHVATRTYPSGLVQNEYLVHPRPESVT